MTSPDPHPPSVPVDLLQTIYQAVDVGVNTCKGEGWGLVNFEHAACKVAQIVPNHTSCKEIFEDCGLLIRSVHADVDTNFGRIMPCPDDNHLAELLGQVYEDRELLNSVAEKCYNRVTDEEFHWETIGSQFDEVFQGVLATQEEQKPQIVKPKGKKKTKK